MQQTLLSRDARLARIGATPVLGPLRGIGDGAALLRRAHRMAAIFKQLGTDIETAHIHPSMIIARLAGVMAATKIRTSMVPGPFHLESTALARPDRISHRLDHLIIGGSKMVAGLYREMGVPEERLAYSYYGPRAEVFDPGRFQRHESRAELFGISADVPLIGQVAYFRPPRIKASTPDSIRGRGLKGHEDFIRAAEIVLARRPDAQFALIGSGVDGEAESYRYGLQKMVSKLGLSHAIHFLGERKDVPELLACFDVAVQCSLLENLGGTIESLLMERPTIATRVGGMPESVRDGETGAAG